MRYYLEDMEEYELRWKYEWMENMLPSRSRFLLLVTGIGGPMLGFFLSFFLVFITIIVYGFLETKAPEIGLMFNVFLPIGIVLGVLGLYRFWKSSFPERVGFGEKGVIFEDNKGRRMFVYWNHIIWISPLSWSKAKECFVEHWKGKRGKRTKMVSNKVAKEIVSRMRAQGYDIEIKPRPPEPLFIPP